MTSTPRTFLTACVIGVLVMVRPAGATVYNDGLEALAHRYYQFTYINDPVGSTDNGLHLADDRLADFSSQAQGRYLGELRRFRSELATKIPPADASVHEQVNYLLLRAAMEGDWWRITYLQSPARDPSIYEGECSNGIFSLLKKPFASAEVRAKDAIGRLRACPGVLEQGKQNLTYAVREFAQVASEDVASGDSLYTRSLDSLDAGIRPQTKAELQTARSQALAALHGYKSWIDANLSSWPEGGFAVGKDQYNWYLRRVLLLPYTETDLTALATTELARDRALEQWERNRDRALPAAHRQPVFKSKAAFLKYYEGQTARVRAFLVSHKIVTVPEYIGAFHIVELPDALKAVNPGGFMNPPGTFDNDPSGFYFVPDYDPKNNSFFAAQARKAVMPVLAHEGIPGHFMQFTVAYHNRDFIRHVQGDGVFAEGWAFYTEEMLMRAGLYDNDPAARDAVIHLMRHRATRIGVDVGLATGAMTLPQAIGYFQENAGIDRETAQGEGTRFAMGPGQAIDYLTGKTQIEMLLGKVRDRQGDAFDLREFHDKLLSYGTVPYSTILWEWLGDPSWIDAVKEPLPPVQM